MSANVSMSIVASAARRTLLALMATTAMQVAGVAEARASAAALPGHFSGGAEGIGAGVAVGGAPLILVHSAAENCPCQGTNGVPRSVTMPSASIPNVLSASTNTASGVASKTASTATASDSATVSAVSLFDGAITADTITATAGVAATASTLATSSAGTTLVNLVIAGTPISADVPENTVVDLPGIGKVKVKLVRQTGTTQDASITVAGLEVFVTENNKYGLSVGTRIKVGSASAGFSRVQPVAVLAGEALTGTISGDVIAGLPGNGKIGAAVGTPGCTGTGGATNTRTTENLAIAGLMQAASGTVTAFAGPVGAANVTRATSVVTNVSLLGGVITAQTLSAVATETRSGTVSTSDTTGSGFEGLTIAGVPVLANAKPNLMLTVPDFGTVIINEQVAKPALGSVSVTALDVSITKANLLGIPVGTHMTLGAANAVARRF